MLRAMPKNWFSWDFRFLDGEREVGFLDSTPFNRTATLTVEGEDYRIRREGLLGALVLEQDDDRTGQRELARAELERPFGRLWRVRAGDRQLTLKGRWPSRRGFELLHGEREVGSMVRESWFGRAATVDFPEDLPLATRLFLAALVIYRWRKNRARHSG